MAPSIIRALAIGVFGAVAGAVCLVIAFTWKPDLTLEMDRAVPRMLSGVYAAERDGDLTFAWTSGRAELGLKGLDRRVTWICSLRFRGARGDPALQPTVDLAIDGITLASARATNEFQDLEVEAPRQERPGLRLAVAVSPTFVPGPRDMRELGVQVDRLGCRPDQAGIIMPPRRLIVEAMLAGAVWGAALAVLTTTAGAAVAGTLLLAILQAVPFSSGPAPYSSYSDLALRLAIWIACAMVVTVLISERWTRQRLRQTARFVVGLSAVVLYLKLLALLHPSKPLVDAVFQAHRLEWVLSGRYFFTQPMPDGVQFPYAIGLYVFAAPWSLLTSDHVTLLRVVVCVVEAIAGALLYPMIVRTSGDRLWGAFSTALFSVVPLSFVVLGNANLTNAFGQSIALMTICAATILPLQPRRFGQCAALTALAALAYLSHVSTFALLLVTLTVMAFLFWRLGGPALRTPARWVFLAATLAFVFSVSVYYGHFVDVYKGALRVRATNVSTLPAQAPRTADSDERSAPNPRRAAEVAPLHTRVKGALVLSARAVGWPILMLATIGAWRLAVARRRDRLALAVLGWGLTYLAFLAVSLMRVDVQYQRYAYEFVGRIVLATYPAAVILAGHGAAWAWRAGIALRVTSLATLVAALVSGARSWLEWMT